MKGLLRQSLLLCQKVYMGVTSFRRHRAAQIEARKKYQEAREQQNKPAQPAHVAVVVPVEAQEVLADPKATKEQIEQAHDQTIEIPDPAHTPAPRPKLLSRSKPAPAE